MIDPPKTFPWARMMQLGMGTLGLSPTEFWRSSPREIAAAMGSSQPIATTTLLRQNLNQMMENYPDD
jgi:uncharacterized phage protein (TIGR02216 family)